MFKFKIECRHTDQAIVLDLTGAFLPFCGTNTLKAALKDLPQPARLVAVDLSKVDFVYPGADSQSANKLFFQTLLNAKNELAPDDPVYGSSTLVLIGLGGDAYNSLIQAGLESRFDIYATLQQATTRQHGHLSPQASRLFLVPSAG